MSSLPDAVRQRLAARVAGFVDEHRLPGCAAGVVIDGVLDWSYGFGWADRAHARRPDAATLYRIASITKTFTASAVLQLRDRGLIRLDDPLVAYVPQARAITNPFGPVEDITIRRLLLHTSGLQGEHPFDDPRVLRFTGIAGLLADLHRVRVVIPPDTQTKYCNIGFQLLGAVVEQVGGRPFMRYVERELLEPLGMSATAFTPQGGLAERRAVGYDGRRHSDDLPRARTLDSADFEADGGLWSCVDDLARWLGFQMSDRWDVIAKATRQEMRRPWIAADARGDSLQGLCWYWTRRDDELFVGHSGQLDGFMSNVAMSPDDRAGSIALLNGIGPADDLAHALLAVVLAEVRSRPPAPPARPPAPPTALVAATVGAYVSEDGSEAMRIEWRGEALWACSDDETCRLEPTDDPDVWIAVDGRGAGEAIRFLRDAQGVIDALNMWGYPLVRLR